MITKSVKSRVDKRSQFISPAERSSSHVLRAGIVVLAIAVIVGSALFVMNQTRTNPARIATADAPAVGDRAPRAATLGHAPYPQLVADQGIVRLPLEAFEDGVAQHYTYMHGDQPIEVFVVRSADGETRVAFNACDVCYRAKKGYHQEGDDMVCNNCGRHFPTDQINLVQGGCNPAPLERVLEAGELILRVEDIVAGARFF